MESDLFYTEIFAGSNDITAGTSEITFNTTPTNLTYTNPLPATINIPYISNAFEFLKLDNQANTLLLSILTIFVLCLQLENYFKAIIVLIISLLFNSDFIYGFIFAFATFSVGEVARGSISYLIVLAIIFLHMIIKSNFITNVLVSSINIDALFLIVEGIVIVLCIVFPLITIKKDNSAGNLYPATNIPTEFNTNY